MGIKVRRRKGTKNLYIRGTVRGQYVDETTGTSDPEAAEAVRIKREAQLLDRSVFGEHATKSFIEAALEYLENGGEGRFVGEFDPKTSKWDGLIGEFGARQLATIKQADLDKAARKLYPTATPETRNRQVYTPFVAIWNRAHAGEETRRWRRPKMDTNKQLIVPGWAEPEYVFALADSITDNSKLRALVLWFPFTGRRITETCNVEWKDVRLSERAVVIKRSKNGEPFTVHLPDPLFDAIANLPGERTGRLFGFENRFAVYTELKEACQNAGLEYLPPHQLGRHTYGTWLRLYANLDTKAIGEAGGWKDLKSVTRYTHVRPNEASLAADMFPRSGKNPGRIKENQRKSNA